MIVADVAARHILVLHTGDSLADFLALDARDIAEHPFVAEIILRQIVGRQRRGVIGGQGDQVVEDAGPLRRVALEGADAVVGLDREVGAVVIDAHQLGAVIGADILAFLLPRIEHLLAEVQRPVEAGRVVIGELRIGHDFADAVDHAGDLFDVRLFGLDPDQVGTVLQAGDAVENAAILAGSGAELIEVGGQALGSQQLAVTVDQHVAGVARARHLFAIEEGVILVAQVARFAGEGDLLGQARAQAVGARDDDAVLDAHFHEGVPQRADLLQEILVRHGDLAVLVAALLFVRHLIFDLQRAGAGLDHLLGEQIGRLGIAEARVDVRDDRYDVRFMIVDRVLDLLCLHLVPGGARGVEFAEQAAQLAGVGLAQEGIDFLDQRGNAGLFVHRLVGQGAEFAAQRGDHPARQIDVTALGGAEMLLDRDHLLLRDEAVPAAERLGVVGGIGVIGGHVGAHDAGGVARDIDAGLELVLRAHPGDIFRTDRIPASVLIADEAARLGHVFGVAHDQRSLRGGDEPLLAKGPRNGKRFVNKSCEICQMSAY